MPDCPWSQPKVSIPIFMTKNIPKNSPLCYIHIMSESTGIKKEFRDLGIDEEICTNLEKIGIKNPTEVQSKVIPLILEGKNLMFQSETGTGKTFAYLLPLLSELKKSENSEKNISLIIASPTYELASQIKLQIQLISEAKCCLCIGGSPLTRQIDALRQKPEIVIGGPFRLLELIHLKKLKTNGIKAIVLDEADRLFSPELRESTEALIKELPDSVQLIGNSATVNEYTRKALERARKNEDREKEVQLIKLPASDVLTSKIEHWAIFAQRREKIDTLRSFINAVKPEKLIVFTGRTDQVQNIVSKLQYRKIKCAGLSSKTDKKERKAAIDRFKSGKINVLVTTDLASRGLDIPSISHVVQMDLPEGNDFFIHRAGRTARAGARGINCVIGDELEMKNYADLEKKLHIKVYPKELYGGKLVKPEDIQ